MYTSDDIEVMILTVNRLNYFKKSLESVLNQTEKVKVTVIENAGNDGTEEYVKSLMETNPNLHYFRQKELVPFDVNFKTASDLACARYVMFFHDDDILHPQYIEYAVKILNKCDDIDIICSLMKGFKGDNEPEIQSIEKAKYVYFKDKTDFAAHAYRAFCADWSSIIFPNIIYKTENVKNSVFEHDKYGKILDKPFVINSIKSGGCVQFRENFLYYRTHEGQDTKNSNNGPFENEINNHNKFFKEFMNKSFKTRIYFDVLSDQWLFILNGMCKGKLSKEDKKEIIKNAYKEGAINPYTYNLFFSPFRFLIKPFNKYMIKKNKKAIKKLKVETL